MDCTPALAPVGDVITDLSTVTITVTHYYDALPMSLNDLQPAGGAWPPTLDATGRIATYGWIAPPGSAGVTYLLTMAVSPTREGRIFVRDWRMVVLPLLG